MALAQISSKTGTKYYIIIDEWDALFREAKEDEGINYNTKSKKHECLIEKNN
ncbi:MAG: hypothetical protein IJZ34_15935 [Lachnospiraceae bacterium]|nr:hypothetical protein [Lachnospiraceae bacterium]